MSCVLARKDYFYPHSLTCLNSAQHSSLLTNSPLGFFYMLCRLLPRISDRKATEEWKRNTGFLLLYQVIHALPGIQHQNVSELTTFCHLDHSPQEVFLTWEGIKILVKPDLGLRKYRYWLYNATRTNSSLPPFMLSCSNAAMGLL